MSVIPGHSTDVDLVVTRGDHEPVFDMDLGDLPGVTLYVNPYQESVNHARLLALTTGTAPYLMWLDPDDDLCKESLKDFIRKFQLEKPELGAYVPMKTIRVGGEVVIEPCDPTTSLIPRTTHMNMIFKRSFGIEHSDYFKNYLWGDYLLRISLLTIGKDKFIKIPIKPFSSWKTWTSDGGVKCEKTASMVAGCFEKAKEITLGKF